LKQTLQDFPFSSNLKFWRQSPNFNAPRETMVKRASGTEVRRAAASVAERARRDMGGLTPNERRSARSLLADYPLAGLDTVARLAATAGVSAPTVLRMIAKLGFRSYGAFQAALRAELAARLEPPLMKGAGLSGDGRLARFAATTAANVAETAANIARDEFDAVVTLLADRHRPVHLRGGRFTDPLADYMAAHLRVLRPNVRRIVGERLTWLDQLLDVGKRDAILLFDIRRYSEDLSNLALEAVKRGATVVLFTDQWLSPVSKVARHVLPAHVVAPSMWDSGAGLLLLIEALLSATAAELGASARTRLNAIESMR
jgi:DNA-binding MurR/RpiR family transcriptional regulator